MTIGKAKVLVTTVSLYERKIAALRESLPNLKPIILVGANQTGTDGTLDFQSLIDESSNDFTIGPTDPEDIALLHFTSGTTGTPKGAVHVHEAVVAHHITEKLALDLHPGDVFWCNADPGWVTGTSYGIIAPLTNGVTSIIDEGDFDAERWYRILQEQRVSVWYTAPTAIRMMMMAGSFELRRCINFQAWQHWRTQVAVPLSGPLYFGRVVIAVLLAIFYSIKRWLSAMCASSTLRII